MNTIALSFCLPLGFALSTLGNSNVAIDDGKLIEGKWKISTQISDGKPLKSKDTLILQFKGGKIVATANGKPAGTGEYQLTQDKTPRWIDIKLNDLSFCGIYKLEKNKLQICHSDANVKKRPTKFVSEADSPNKTFAVLKRIEDE